MGRNLHQRVGNHNQDAQNCWFHGESDLEKTHEIHGPCWIQWRLHPVADPHWQAMQIGSMVDQQLWRSPGSSTRIAITYSNQSALATHAASKLNHPPVRKLTSQLMNHHQFAHVNTGCDLPYRTLSFTTGSSLFGGVHSSQVPPATTAPQVSQPSLLPASCGC